MSDSEPHLGEDSPEEFLDSMERRFEIPGVVGYLLIAIAGFALLSVLWQAVRRLPGGRSSGDVHVVLCGDGVSELRPGDRVVLGSVQVGEVEQTSLRDGEVLAELRIDGKHAAEIPESSRFEVDSLNQWVPGNLGVRIRSDPARADRPSLVDGAEIEAAKRTLPPTVPERFYPLVALGVGAIVVLVICARVLRSIAWMVIVAGVLILLAALVHLGGTIVGP